ncbi:DNA uptake channel protein ComEC [Commensalibacter communis]|uniref:ComEC/Rec2 family competence protein n=1 Tax=Commensalibacter communis TaxID=2972786 RepID=UPI0022FF677D|nr:ComEC/Rec2 family competence protein [Commensalibacter communis]CAI3928787.1 DNA uptake channel protein ComEC [Commensalibacter communis]CAI3930478.1 DNA uptake channel protein ComEC [Commensalibacter communis]
MYQYLYIETESLRLWIPIAFAVGCLAYFLLPFEPSIIWGCIFSVIGLTAVIIIRRYYTAYLGLYQISWTITLIASGFCLAWLQTYRQEPFYAVPSRATVVQGQIQSIEYLNNGKKRITLQQVRFKTAPESDQQKWERVILFTLSKKDNQFLRNGDLVQARVMLHRPAPPQYVGGYDLQFRSWFNNIGAYGYALEPVKLISVHPIYSIQSLREKIAAHIREINAGSAGIIAQILLTGMGGELSPDVRHAFAASGLAHLLAIAGLHLGIVMGIVAFTVRWLLLRSQTLTLYWPIKTIAIIVGWTVGCGYLVLTGLHIPAMRSLLMASIVMLALLCNRSVFSKYNLMLAALFLLLLSPASVLDVSFQMSMTAVMALVSGYQLIYRWLEKYQQINSYLFRFIKVYILEGAWVSILAGTAVVPVVMFYFHELNLYFVFANLIAVPLTALWVMPLGLLTLCTMTFGFDYIFLKLMTFGIDWIIWLAELVSHLPYASVSVPNFPAWGYALYFLGLCILCLCITAMRWFGIIVMIIGISSIFCITTPTIITSPNGRMIGINHQHRLLMVCQGGCDPIAVEEWRKITKLTEVKAISSNTIEAGIYCNKDYCFIKRKRILILLKSITKDQQENLCQSSLIELSFLWNESFCKNIPVINKKENWINGAHSIWLDPLIINTDIYNRGRRPWVMEPIQRGVPKMPMAQQE